MHLYFFPSLECFIGNFIYSAKFLWPIVTSGMKPMYFNRCISKSILKDRTSISSQSSQLRLPDICKWRLSCLQNHKNGKSNFDSTTWRKRHLARGLYSTPGLHLLVKHTVSWQSSYTQVCGQATCTTPTMWGTWLGSPGRSPACDTLSAWWARAPISGSGPSWPRSSSVSA